MQLTFSPFQVDWTRHLFLSITVEGVLSGVHIRRISRQTLTHGFSPYTKQTDYYNNVYHTCQKTVVLDTKFYSSFLSFKYV